MFTIKVQGGWIRIIGVTYQVTDFAAYARTWFNRSDAEQWAIKHLAGIDYTIG